MALYWLSIHSWGINLLFWTFEKGMGQKFMLPIPSYRSFLTFRSNLIWINNNLTNHDTSWNSIPFKPKSDEWWCDEYYAWDENCCKIECPISSKYKIHLKTAVIACTRKKYNFVKELIYKFALFKSNKIIKMFKLFVSKGQ